MSRAAISLLVAGLALIGGYSLYVHRQVQFTRARNQFASYRHIHELTDEQKRYRNEFVVPLVAQIRDRSVIGKSPDELQDILQRANFRFATQEMVCYGFIGVPLPEGGPEGEPGDLFLTFSPDGKCVIGANIDVPLY